MGFCYLLYKGGEIGKMNKKLLSKMSVVGLVVLFVVAAFGSSVGSVSIKKDVLPLKGKKGYFRVRKGMFRIIFYKKGKTILIVKVAKRDERTYD